MSGLDVIKATLEKKKMQNQQSNSKGNSSTNKVSKGSQVAVNKPQKKSTGRGR